MSEPTKAALEIAEQGCPVCRAGLGKLSDDHASHVFENGIVGCIAPALALAHAIDEHTAEAVQRALTVLVKDEIISAGRAGEIGGMSADEQRRFWRVENSYVQGMKIVTHIEKATAELRAEVERLRAENSILRAFAVTYFGGSNEKMEEMLTRHLRGDE